VKLVLLPGMDGTGRLFADFIAAVQGEFDMLVVCYPRQRALSYVELERLVRSELPDCEPFLLVAESFSTPIAIRCAATAPENLKGLVLCAGFIQSPLKGLRRFAALALAPIIFRWSAPNSVLRLFLIGRDGDSSLPGAVRTVLSDVKPEVLVARLRYVLHCDERLNFQRLRIPTLLIRPTKDRLIPVSSYEETCTTNPMIEIVEIEGPHLVLQTNAAQAAEVVSRFAKANA
jgi:pimeloyl-[acyl-carrier protein] methyl ester esterase